MKLSKKWEERLDFYLYQCNFSYEEAVRQIEADMELEDDEA